MCQPLKGKLAIITGASRGIGAAIAENLAAKGSNLVLTYSSASSVEEASSLAASLIEKYSVDVYPIRADMGEQSGPASIIAQTAQHFSPLRIDILINNAAVAPQAMIADVSVADFQLSYAVNVLGPILLLQAALPHLPHDRTGRVINVSSCGSALGLAGQTVYAGTKAALESMTRTWSRELAERATVNAVTPGPTRTAMYANAPAHLHEALRPCVEMTPLAAVREGADSAEIIESAKKMGGRMAEPSEVAGIVGMLCTPDSAWCTGQVVSASGGMIFGLQ